MLGANYSSQTNAKFSAVRCPTHIPAIVARPLRRGNIRCNSTPKWKRTPQSISGPDPDQSSNLQAGPPSYSAADADQSPDAVAKRQRERAAAVAAGEVEQAGQQLSSSAGETTKDVETVLADGQGQLASAASDAAGDYREDATQFERQASQTAASASAAAADTQAGRQEDASRVEGAVSRGTDQASSAVADTIRSVPTAADAVRGVGDGAAGALRGLSQAGSQVSSAAGEFQRGADGLASEVQRSAETGGQEIQDRLNKASAKAETTARDLRQGTTTKRGKSLLSDTARLTSMSGGGKDNIDGLKTKLLAHVAGLDRGFAAAKRQTEAVQAVVDELVAASDPVNLVPQPSASPVATPNAAYGAATPQAPKPSRVMTPGVASSGVGTPGVVTGVTGVSTLGVASPGVYRPGTTSSRVPASGGSPPGSTPGALSSTPSASGRRLMAGPTSGTASGMSDTSSGTPSSGKNCELGGLWRLVYSSGFARRNTGGARPGVPINLFPAQFGQVYQDINTTTNRLDNVVELRRPALPVPSWAPIKPLPAEALLTLKHRLAITAPATVTITFTGTDVNLQGGLGGILNGVPQFELPNLPDQLQPPRKSRSASFQVIYLDEDIRITRGDRKELRVFLRT